MTLSLSSFLSSARSNTLRIEGTLIRIYPKTLRTLACYIFSSCRLLLARAARAAPFPLLLRPPCCGHSPLTLNPRPFYRKTHVTAMALVKIDVHLSTPIMDRPVSAVRDFSASRIFIASVLRDGRASSLKAPVYFGVQSANGRRDSDTTGKRDRVKYFWPPLALPYPNCLRVPGRIYAGCFLLTFTLTFVRLIRIYFVNV